MSRDAGSMIPTPTGVFNPDSLLNKSPRQTLTNAIRPGTAKRPGFARSVDVPAPAPRTSFAAPTPGPGIGLRASPSASRLTSDLDRHAGAPVSQMRGAGTEPELVFARFFRVQSWNRKIAPWIFPANPASCFANGRS